MPTNKHLTLFGLPLLLLLSVGVAFLLVSEKGTLVLFFARHRTTEANVFFRYVTLLGDGVVVVLFCFIAALIRYRYTLMMLAVGIGQLVLSALFKRIVFGNTPRPLRYFDGHVDPAWLIDQVDVHTNYAFPSGHTITAFGLALFIALMVQKRWVTVLSLFAAALIGLSRVYLFQHFFEDVLLGAFIGTANTAVIFHLFANWSAFWNSRFWSISLLERRGIALQ